VFLVGHANVPARLAADASQLYAKNVLNFLSLSYDKDTKGLSINWDDEIIKGTLLCRDGTLVHPSFAN
jgi:NAD(P) transhydrogenase subunit alpha